MKLVEKHIEWLVAIAVVLITTYGLFRSLMETLNSLNTIRYVGYLTIPLLCLIFLHQRYHYGRKILDKFFFAFYFIYYAYVFFDMTLFRRYPLDKMVSVPPSIPVYFYYLVISIGYLLCAKTIVLHFNLKKYLFLSLIICTIPSIMFIHYVGVEVIQAGIGEDDEQYINTLNITYSNIPMLVLAVMNFNNLLSKKWLSMLVCSGIIAAVLYILLSYGKRGPMLWSFVSIIMCFIIKSVSRKKIVSLFGIIIVTFVVFLDPIIDGIKEVLPRTGKKLELSLKEGNTSGRFNMDDPKHSTYLIGLENFSCSPIWGYYFRLVTDYKHYQGTYAHNVFIEILQTMGLLGFIPFVLLLLKAYHKSRTVFVRSHTPNQMSFFILFLCVFLQLQTTGTCVFKNSFWLFFYILCCLEKIGCVHNPSSYTIER